MTRIERGDTSSASSRAYALTPAINSSCGKTRARARGGRERASFTKKGGQARQLIGRPASLPSDHDPRSACSRCTDLSVQLGRYTHLMMLSPWPAVKSDRDGGRAKLARNARTWPRTRLPTVCRGGDQDSGRLPHGLHSPPRRVRPAPDAGSPRRARLRRRGHRHGGPGRSARRLKRSVPGPAAVSAARSAPTPSRPGPGWTPGSPCRAARR